MGVGGGASIFIYSFTVATENVSSYDTICDEYCVVSEQVEAQLDIPNVDDIRQEVINNNSDDEATDTNGIEYDPSDEVKSFVSEVGLTPFLSVQSTDEYETETISDEEYDIVIDGDVTISTAMSYSNKKIKFDGNVIVTATLSLSCCQVYVTGNFIATGNYSQTIPDIKVQTVVGTVEFSHTYNSLNIDDSGMGQGFTFSHNIRLDVSGLDESTRVGTAIATLAGGSCKTFDSADGITFYGYDNHAKIILSNNKFTLTDTDNTKIVFDSNGHIMSMSDAKGNTLLFTTNSIGDVTHITDVSGSSISVSYDSDGRLTEIIDNSANRTASFTYTNGLLTSSVNMYGQTTSYEYDEDDRLYKIHDTTNLVVQTITYCSDGKINTVTDVKGNCRTYTYSNHLTTITDSNCRTTVQAFDDGRSINEVKNPLNESVLVEYKQDANGTSRYGEISRKTDEGGNVTLYEYDASGNVTEITYADGSSDHYFYDNQNNVIKHIDRMNTATYYEYDSNNCVLTIAVRISGTDDYNPQNAESFSVTSYTYYSTNTYGITGLVHTETGPLGNVTSYTYDTKGRVLTKTVSFKGTNKTDTYTYDSFGRLATITDADGIVTAYTYNNKDQIIKKTVNGTVVERTVYDVLGRKVYEINPALYDSQYDNSNTDTYSNPNHGTHYSYDLAGNVILVTDAEGNTTSYQYDSYGNVLKEIYANHSYTRYTYDALNRLLNTYICESANATEQLLQCITYSRSGNRQIITTKDYLSSSLYSVTKECKDFEENIVVGEIYNGSESSPYSTITYTYANGKLISETTPDGTTVYSYDALGNVTAITAPFDGTHYTHIYRTYDKAGNMTQELVQNNLPGETETTSRTDYTYDAWSNCMSVKQYEGNTVASKTVYTYNYRGQLLSEASGSDTVQNNITTCTYDACGNCTSKTDSLNHTESYVYDAANNVISYTDKNGAVTTYTYDGNNRITGEQTTKSGHTTITKSFTYDCMGNLTALTENQSTITYTYDGFGNMLTETCGSIVKTYTYDRAGNVLTATVTDGNELTEQFTYTYDFLGRLYQVRDGNTLKATYTYDNMSRLTVTTYPRGVTETTVYNAAGLPISVTNAHGNEIISQFTYTYYLNGNQRSKTDESGTTYYEYNDRGYLTRTTYPDASYDAYAYDANGNRTEKLSVSQEIVNDRTIYTYNNDNRLTQKQSTVPEYSGQSMLSLLQSINIDGTTYYVTTYTYDSNGNMTGSVYEEDADDEYTVTQTFDLLDRLISYTNTSTNTEAAYTYYPDNKRESKTVTIINQSNQGVLSLPQSVAEPQSIKQNTTTTTTHIWLGSDIAFDIQDDAMIKYLHGIKLIESDFGLYLYDAHGNVTELLDNEYNVVQSYTYDPFGIENGAESSIRDTDMAEEMSIGGDMQSVDINSAIDDAAGLNSYTDPNPYRYCGEYFDNETGYVYLRARYYAPTLGRFISEDTAKDGYNWYVYCGNDPVNRVDPSGKAWYHWVGAAAIVVAFAALTVISAGGFAAGMTAIALAANGIASASLATSIAAGATVLSGCTLGALGLVSAGTAISSSITNNSSAISEFNALGSSETIGIVAGAAIDGGISGAISWGVQSRNQVQIQNEERIREKGWHVGDPIDNLTAAGNEPSWTTVKQRHWKNEAYYNASSYSAENINRMCKGLAPLVGYKNGKLYPMELHHPNGRTGKNFYDFIRVTPWEHSEIDPNRYWKP